MNLDAFEINPGREDVVVHGRVHAACVSVHRHPSTHHSRSSLPTDQCKTKINHLCCKKNPSRPLLLAYVITTASHMSGGSRINPHQITGANQPPYSRRGVPNNTHPNTTRWSVALSDLVLVRWGCAMIGLLGAPSFSSFRGARH
jgi:hypothetical protein